MIRSEIHKFISLEMPSGTGRFDLVIHTDALTIIDHHLWNFWLPYNMQIKQHLTMTHLSSSIIEQIKSNCQIKHNKERHSFRQTFV